MFFNLFHQDSFEILVYLARGYHSLINNSFIEKVNCDEIAYLTFEKLKCSIKNFVSFQINNNFYEPFITYGDYIGGIITDNISLLNSKLTFYKDNGILLVGILHYIENGKVFLRNYLNLEKEIQITQTTQIGAVNWIMKRYD